MYTADLLYIEVDVDPYPLILTMADQSQGSSQGGPQEPNTTQNIFGDESMHEGATQVVNGANTQFDNTQGGSMPSSSFIFNPDNPESSDAPNPGESSSSVPSGTTSDAVLFGDSGQTQDYAAV